MTLENRVSHAAQEAVTDEQGRFTLNNVAFGTYVLNVSLPGFTPVEQVVEIRSTVPLVRDVELKIGGVQETVNVSGDALLETSSTGSHVDIGAALIDQLPTATPSKQLSAMLLSAPGFIPSQNGRVHVRGSHGQIQYVVDGVPMTDEYSEAFANPLDPRYVKSAEVMTGGIPAEYGGKLAAVVDITSKSGLDEPRKAFGNASLNVGRFGAVDGGVTVGGRVSLEGRLLPERRRQSHRSVSRSADGRQLPQLRPRASGSRASSSCGRPTPTSSARSSRSTAAASRRRIARTRRTPASTSTQELTDNSQTITWLHQLGHGGDARRVAYRRAATATLDALERDAARGDAGSLARSPGRERVGQRDERHAPLQGGRAVRPQPDRRALPDDRQRPRRSGDVSLRSARGGRRSCSTAGPRGRTSASSCRTRSAR